MLTTPSLAQLHTDRRRHRHRRGGTDWPRMAKVLASRAHSDAALQERLERAAARFPSIHARWGAITSDAPRATPGSERDPAAAGDGLEGRGELALPISESGVCVTPILGIAATTDDEPRPRFKTLMGVPRDELDADEPSSSEALSEARQEQSSLGGAPPRPTRPTPPPLPDRFLALPEAAPSPSRLPDGAAATTRLQTFAPAARTAPPQRLMLAQSSPDIAAEVAGLRRSQRRRSWLVGVGSFAATLAVFAIAAPRERALAARWLRDEYQARVQPSLRTVADTARALKPSLVEPVDTRSGSAEQVDAVNASAEMRRIEAAAALAASDVRPDPEISAPPTLAAPAMEVVSKPAAETSPPSGQRPSSSMVPAESRDSSARAEVLMDGADPSPAVAKRESTARTSQVAAPRKRSTRAAAGRATTADVKPRAARATKERAARQNSPRRATNGGIIRETPF